ncbi:hypothetical protein DM2_2240 [Halorubrum sp. DM2]|nr:hypothetical protein DM2_2240 [Halorubrum sp. DM2]
MAVPVVCWEACVPVPLQVRMNSLGRDKVRLDGVHVDVLPL